MGQFRDELQNILDRVDPTDALDVLLIAFVIYWVLLLLRGTAAITLLRGAAIILVGFVILAQTLDLEVLDFVIRNSFAGLIIAVPIIFQPEIRRALERVGRTGLRMWARPTYDDLIDAVSAAAMGTTWPPRSGRQAPWRAPTSRSPRRLAISCRRRC